MRQIIGIMLAGIVAQITGNAIWVLSLINLAWMLFKDVQLFSWWWVIYSAVAFVVSLCVVFISIFILHD